jgi:putative transposase
MSSNTVSAAVLAQNGVTQEGIKYFQDAEKNGPSRRVGGRRRWNMIFDVPFRRLGVVLQAESSSGEFLFLVEQERNEGLVALLDQPPTIPIEIVDALGRRTRTTHTPDYLMFDAAGACVVEVKRDAELEELVEKRPNVWVKEGSTFALLPARRFFESLGIRHLVIPNSSLSFERADNFRMLSLAMRAPPTAHELQLSKQVLRIVAAEKAIQIGEAMRRVGTGDVTSVLRLISQGHVHADLDHVLLSNHQRVWICATQEDAETLEAADRTLHSLATSSSSMSGDMICPPNYISEVARRAKFIAEISASATESDRRKDRRYRARIRAANGNPIGLVPRWRNCGNRDARISTTHYALLVQHVRDGRSDPHFRSVSQSYVTYKDHVRDMVSTTSFRESPVSKTTYYSLWKTVPGKTSDANRQGGRRLSNKVAASRDPSRRSILATRPFAVAHVDHWKCDIFVRVRMDGKKHATKRPWLSVMIDSHTGEILATWLHFGEPNRVACAMLMRECVRRHARMPEILVTDGGSDFRSRRFAETLATLGVVHAERPPENPRFGSEAERLLGHLKERFVRGLPGFGVSITQSRAVSRGFHAGDRSTLTLTDLAECLAFYVDGHYNQSPRPGELDSPVSIREQALAEFPHSGIRVSWDQSFLIATAVEPVRKYTLWTGKGLHVNGKWYSSPELHAFIGPKKEVSVRVEPYDDSVIYANVGASWFVCQSAASRINATRPDSELVAATTLKRSRREILREAAELEDARLAKSLRLTRSRSRAKTQKAKTGDKAVDGTPLRPTFRYDDVIEAGEEDA